MAPPDITDSGPEEEFSLTGNTIDTNILSHGDINSTDDVSNLPSSVMPPLKEPLYIDGGVLHFLDFINGLPNFDIPEDEANIPSNEVIETQQPTYFQQEHDNYHEMSSVAEAIDNVEQEIGSLANMAVNVPSRNTFGDGTSIVTEQSTGPKSPQIFENTEPTQFSMIEQAAQSESWQIPHLESSWAPLPGAPKIQGEVHQKDSVPPNSAPSASQGPGIKRARQTDRSSKQASRPNASQARKSRTEKLLASKQRTNIRYSVPAATVSAAEGTNTPSTPHIPRQAGGHQQCTGDNMGIMPTNSNMAMNQPNVVGPGMTMNGYNTMSPNGTMMSQGHQGRENNMPRYSPQLLAATQVQHPMAQFSTTAYPDGSEQHCVFGGGHNVGLVPTAEAQAQQFTRPIYRDTLGDL